MKFPILGKQNICYILFAFAIVLFLYTIITEETFANKNPRTILDVHGEVLGFDLISHEGTFDDFDTEPNMPIPLYMNDTN
jgi:hypothetical protein